MLRVTRLPPRVYPRVCGGTSRRCRAQGQGRGLSPRVRGNLAVHSRHATHWRSIPACAGEPAAAALPYQEDKVYPRVCGGTMFSSYWSRRRTGLSPRVRGNQESRQRLLDTGGSIPACAGEPLWHWPMSAAVPVYPRVCGGTTRSPPPSEELRGLSPRVRGNPDIATVLSMQVGSIPACAGEPLGVSMK